MSVLDTRAGVLDTRVSVLYVGLRVQCLLLEVEGFVGGGRTCQKIVPIMTPCDSFPPHVGQQTMLNMASCASGTPSRVLDTSSRMLDTPSSVLDTRVSVLDTLVLADLPEDGADHDALHRRLFAVEGLGLRA